MHKFICLSICSLIFLIAFSEIPPTAGAPEDLSNVSIKITANQRPVVSGSISGQVAGVLAIFDHLGSSQDFTVSVSQNYPATAFTTVTDCFSPNTGVCQDYLPAGLYSIRVEVSDENLKLLSVFDLSQKLLVNSQKSELLQTETFATQPLVSPSTPLNSSLVIPSAVNPVKANIKAKEESPLPVVSAANPELTAQISGSKSQVKGTETPNDDQRPSQILFTVLYISIGLFVLTWGLYFYKRFRKASSQISRVR